MSTTRPLHEMPCAELVERVTDYLEDALPPEDRTRFDDHLDDCSDCALYLEQLRLTLALTGRLQEGDLTPVMRDGLTHAFRRWRWAL